MDYTWDNFICRKKLAEQGDAEALFDLGYFYYYGCEGVEVDLSMSIDCWLKASNGGSAGAKFVLAWCYEYGIGVEKDIFKSFDYIREAAELGYADAQFSVGEKYIYGCKELWLNEDSELAFVWYKKAAEKHHSRAELMVAYMYENGIGIACNTELAVEWYKKSADDGDADAMNNLANCYSVGRGVASDKNMAFQYYLKSAKNGNAMAMYNCGNSYYLGNGVQSNTEQAFVWFKKALDAGYIKAKYNLANMYYSGIGTEQNFELAFNMFEDMFASGDHEFDSDSSNIYFMLGKCYYLGRGTNKNIEMAISIFKECAEKEDGNSEAAYYLGEIYRNGESAESGFQPDYEHSLVYYLRAIDLYNRCDDESLVEAVNLSCFYSGMFYARGRGTQINMQEAAKMWLMGAERNDMDCQYNLAIAYLNGDGVQRDMDKAKIWLQRAANMGMIEAQQMLYEIS